MSQRCNLSTSAVRDSVSARKPPIQPTPITPTSTVFTGHFPRFLRAHKDHDAAGRAMLWTVTLRGSRHRSRGAPLRPSVAKPCHVKREAGEDMEREGWCLCFLIRYARLAKFRSLDRAQRNPGTKVRLHRRSRVSLRSTQATK